MTLSTLSVVTFAVLVLGLKLALLVTAVAWGLRSLFGEFGLLRARDHLRRIQPARVRETHG